MSHKICPICGTAAHSNSTVCSVCGTTLNDAHLVTSRTRQEATSGSPAPDYHFGDSDLFEGDLQWKAGNYLLAGLVVIVIGFIVGAGVLFMPDLIGSGKVGGQESSSGSGIGATQSQIKESLTPPPSSEAPAFVTNTSSVPTPILNTVTLMPTATELPGPCIQRVNEGDDLISLVFRCGHRDLDIIDAVLDENNISNASFIQIGQEIVIPWPTPTIDPHVTPADEETDDSQDGEPASTNIAANLDSDTQRVIPGLNVPEIGTPVIPTEELPSGVGWHNVVLGEDIISIALRYGADVEILSQLNPEVTFSQCDFGIATGGPNCIVQIFEGQRIRVPAPTAPPTLSPTLSGSETPTPTATPTINVPSALSPADRTLFPAHEIITLRWVTTGTLGPGEVYRVVVIDTALDVEYIGATRDLFFIVPETWQGTDGERHRYTWLVSVIKETEPANPIFSTQLLSFVWESRDEDDT